MTSPLDPNVTALTMATEYQVLYSVNYNHGERYDVNSSALVSMYILHLFMLGTLFDFIFSFGSLSRSHHYQMAD